MERLQPVDRESNWLSNRMIFTESASGRQQHSGVFCRSCRLKSVAEDAIRRYEALHITLAKNPVK
jgi:hypothetical protein